ncbi:MAG: hypothetical protein LBG74_06225 [Spirochaetaceae bacterium]|jgi:hypothetical protein|nr:hypothetical protein [Spirochaetaceae bacterium]
MLLSANGGLFAQYYGQQNSAPNVPEQYNEQQGVYVQQGQPIETAVFAPFVSGLRAEAVGKSVTLNWQDSASINGPVYIYRSQEPFYGGTKSNQFEAKEVPFGTQNYTDTVPANGTWYYLAVASDKDSRQRYEMVVPFRNMVEILIDDGARRVAATSWTVPQITPQAYSQAQADSGQPNPAAFRSQALAYGNGGMGDSLPFVEMAQSPINGITATPQSAAVHIQFFSSATGKHAVLYRSINPIMKFGDLLVASVVKLNVTSPHVDYPTPGVPYYYAVVYEEDLMNGQAVLSPGNNTTIAPVEVSRSPSPVVPVPKQSGSYTPAVRQPQPAQPQTARTPPRQVEQAPYAPPPARDGTSMSTIRTPNSVAPAPAQINPPVVSGHMPLVMEARVFNEDRQQHPEGSENYELSQIVQRYIMWRNWNDGRGALMKFLTERRRSAAVESRAHFYLGECAYFLGIYREALSEFVAVQYVFPDETAAWVQACLSKLSGK